MSGSRRSSRSRHCGEPQLDRAPHAGQRGRHVAGLRHREPGPEQQLVVVRGQRDGAGVALAGLVVAPRARELVALVGEVVRVLQVEQALELDSGASVSSTRRSTVNAPTSPAAGTTTIAADWRPRTSPPSRSAACSAASIRRASGPAAASKASAIAGQTPGVPIMLACALKCAPATWPA